MTDANAADGTTQTTLTEEPQTRIGHTRQGGCDRYVGRSDGRDGRFHLNNRDLGERGDLGNPYVFKEEHNGPNVTLVEDREESVRRYRADLEERLETDEELRRVIRGLHGAVLGCWCQRLDDDGPACHGEIIAEHADRLVAEENAETREPGE